MVNAAHASHDMPNLPPQYRGGRHGPDNQTPYHGLHILQA